MITGGCLCGAIRFEIDGHAIGGGFCYCRDCQMVGGGMPAAVAVFHRRALRMTVGSPKTCWTTTERGGRVARTFCPDCGTHLSALNEKPEMVPIRVGVLDDPLIFQPTANLWTRSAQSWHHIDRSLICFETQPES